MYNSYTETYKRIYEYCLVVQSSSMTPAWVCEPKPVKKTSIQQPFCFHENAITIWHQYIINLRQLLSHNELYTKRTYINPSLAADQFMSHLKVQKSKQHWFFLCKQNLYVTQQIYFYIACMYMESDLIGHFIIRPISQISQCIGKCTNASHNAPFCNRNVHKCAHFCYKMVHCGIWDWCIVGFMQQEEPRICTHVSIQSFSYIFYGLPCWCLLKEII